MKKITKNNYNKFLDRKFKDPIKKFKKIERKNKIKRYFRRRAILNGIILSLLNDAYFLIFYILPYSNKQSSDHFVLGIMACVLIPFILMTSAVAIDKEHNK